MRTKHKERSYGNLPARGGTRSHVLLYGHHRPPSVDKKKSYCLYEAPSAEAIREAALRANIPADVIIEVGSELQPDQLA